MLFHYFRTWSLTICVIFSCNLVKHKMAAGKAKIGYLAPDFTAKAVMPDGQFKDLKLSDYRGTTTLHYWFPTLMLHHLRL